jgi:hypothetical protein
MKSKNLNKEIINGALLGKDSLDWVAKGNSPINRRILLESGYWKDLSIPNEIQVVNLGYTNTYDTSMCVSFTWTDAIEYTMMQMLRLSLIPAEFVSWLTANGYFENGVLNFNERFTAIKGETTEDGAFQYKVANGSKNCGLIPQKMFPYADNFKDNIDSRFVTEEMNQMGLEFKKRFYINYEWVNPEDTKEFLKYSPLSCIGQYANGEGILKPPTNTGHSMLLVNETDEYREIDDSYWKQFKKYNKESLQSFMAVYITPLTNSMNITQFLKDNNNKIVRNSNTGAYGVIYNNTPMLISQERAGLFIIDRECRKLIGKLDKIEINDDEWKLLNWVNF